MTLPALAAERRAAAPLLPGAGARRCQVKLIKAGMSPLLGDR